jgi:DeoR family transcriptional regulator, aga operon transcriptional repressor
MLRIERQAKILQMVRDREFVENSELARYFDVTLATIRRDLKMLSEQNLIRQEHGGSSLVNPLDDPVEPSYAHKVFVNHDAKLAIGKASAGLLEDGDSVVLDSGTTNSMIAQCLRGTTLKNLTIITCDILVAKDLCFDQNINVIVLGGQLRRSYYSTYGMYAEMVLRNLRANKYFLGIDAANFDGITNIVLAEVPLKKLMIEISNRVILVADSSKFDKMAPHRVCSWDSISQIITDACIEPRYLEFFKSMSIPTITAVPNSPALN